MLLSMLLKSKWMKECENLFLFSLWVSECFLKTKKTTTLEKENYYCFKKYFSNTYLLGWSKPKY